MDLDKLADDAPKLKSVGYFTISSPDGKTTDPIPYNATMKEIQTIASKVGIRVEDLWNNA